jgi:CRP-like cAMP-binding protein
MFEILAGQSLLNLDPELGQLLSPERDADARSRLIVRVATIPPGTWRPEQLCPGTRAAAVGLLVLDGAILREFRLLNTPSAELLGPGDIIRTWQAETDPWLPRMSAQWHTLGKASVALMDSTTALALRSFPEVMAIVLDRLNARSERLAVTQAISQITGVETRIEALLWHLSERWGRVGREGVILDLALSHRMIGSLVGARRPTVSTAFARLIEAHRVARRADGSWLLLGDTPLAGDRDQVPVAVDIERALVA